MGRYTGPACRLCRRERKKLNLKGTRCDTDKCAMERKDNPPGKIMRMNRRPSGYAIHLREKQKAKRMYGISEHQFRKYFELAARRKGVTGELLLQFLERRLDSVVYRLGFAASRREARQLIAHGHLIVNSRKTDVPSYLLKAGDKMTVREKSKKMIGQRLEAERSVPDWLLLDRKSIEGNVKYLPKRDEIPIEVREELIVELYSK